jgi:hypothetical protein
MRMATSWIHSLMELARLEESATRQKYHSTHIIIHTPATNQPSTSSKSTNSEDYRYKSKWRKHVYDCYCYCCYWYCCAVRVVRFMAFGEIPGRAWRGAKRHWTHGRCRIKEDKSWWFQNDVTPSFRYEGVVNSRIP